MDSDRRSGKRSGRGLHGDTPDRARGSPPRVPGPSRGGQSSSTAPDRARSSWPAAWLRSSRASGSSSYVTGQAGAERIRHTAVGAISGFDLDADGRALLHVPSEKALELVDPSGSVTRVGTGGGLADGGVRLAGNRAVLRVSGRFGGDSHIAVIDLATGQRRRFSPPSLDLQAEEAQLDAEGELVAWAANGCVFAAPLGSPGSNLVPPGPCPRAEINLEENQPERLRGRTARVRLRCVTAPPPGCRGTIRLELDRPTRQGSLSHPRRRTRDGSRPAHDPRPRRARA